MVLAESVLSDDLFTKLKRKSDEERSKTLLILSRGSIADIRP